MKKTYALVLILLTARLAYAQGGMEGLGIVIVLSIISLLAALVLFISAVKRFSARSGKVSRGLNVSGAVLITSASLSLAIIGEEVDSGYLNTCIAAVSLSVLLIILNHSVGLKRNVHS